MDNLHDMLTPNHTAFAAVSAVPIPLSPSERFMMALALSAYVRQLAWQGAKQHAGSRGQAAVVDRFLQQLYGADVAAVFRSEVAPRE